MRNGEISLDISNDIAGLLNDCCRKVNQNAMGEMGQGKFHFAPSSELPALSYQRSISSWIFLGLSV
jgi:hypothetical protein